DRDIGVVPSFGLAGGTDVDVIHFTGPSQVEYGGRYGRMAMLSSPPLQSPANARRANGAAMFITVEKDGSGDFDDLEKAIQFISTVSLDPGCRGRVSIGAGQWNIGATGLRLSLLQGEGWEFTGVLAGGFVAPTKADFTGTAAADLSMLRSKYLTEIVFESHGLICGGSNAGRWNDMLLSVTSPGLLQAAVRTDDPALPKNYAGGRIK